MSERMKLTPEERTEVGIKAQRFVEGFAPTGVELDRAAEIVEYTPILLDDVARLEAENENLKEVARYASLVLNHYHSNHVADLVRDMDGMHRALARAGFPVTNPDLVGEEKE